jgi:MYXO-CTERM domain-containing protein
MPLRRASSAAGWLARTRLGWRLLLAPVVVLLGAGDVSAYCRTRTCQLSRNVPCARDAATGCYTNGDPVFWGDTCLSYAIQRDGSIAEGITAEQVAPLVADAFRAWSDVTCANGGTPPITALGQGNIACDGVEFNCEQPEANSNLIIFRDEFVDTLPFRFGVIALTTLTASKITGQIFDADIELNSRDEDFVLGPVPEGSRARDLRGVLNHEVGHLLGLSHPYIRGALMYDSYEGTVLPAADDIAGICEIRGGSSSDPECSVTELPSDAGCVGRDTSCKNQLPEATEGEEEQDAGCACQLGAVSATPRAWAWLSGLALAGWLRRRR